MIPTVPPDAQGWAIAEATLRTFYEVSPLLMGTVELAPDGDLVHLYDNPATSRFFGVPPGSTHGRRARELGVPEEVIALWRAKYEEAGARSEAVTFEYVEPATASSRRRLAVTVGPLNISGPSGGPTFCYVAEEITQRREAEAQMRELLATVDLGAFIARDPDGTIRHWSRGCERIYGWTAEEAVGRLTHDLLRTRFPVPLAEIEAALDRSGEWSGDLRHVTRDGCEIIVKASLVLRTDVAGQTAVLEAITDVTAQRKAEAALAESEARLRTIVETVPVGLVMAELPSGRIVGGNAYVEKLLGHPVLHSPDIHSYGEWVAFHADGTRVDGHEYPLARMVQCGEENPSVEVLYQRGDGRRAWTRIMGRPVRDAEGRLIGGVVALVDVDAERRTREALAESEARLRLATEAGRVGIFDWDLRTGALQWDDRLRELWSAPAGLPVGIDTFYAGLHPGDRETVKLAIGQAFDPASQGIYEAEFRVQGLSDGVERHVSARGRVWFDEGRAVRMVGTAVDVTAQRRAEAVLARDKAELETLVEDRTRELQHAQSRLAHAQRMEALGQLAGGIAHDFNNVLQAVQGGARLIERRPGDSEEVRRLARMVSEAAGRGAATTRRLLAFSRRSDLRAEPVDAAILLGGMRDILAHTLGAEVEVRIRVEPGLPQLLADRSQLETVLVNLATNARDAMQAGGVLTYSARLETRAPGTLDGGVFVRVDVSDTGAGMPPEVLARVTEPFFTTKPQGKGTGLGLAMAKGFAEQSGGALSVESKPGHGTTVTLWFPVAMQEDSRPAAEPPEDEPPATRAVQIVLVDDEELVRELTREQLEGRGFSVAAFESGPAALAALAAGQCADLLVTDLSMPGMDGLCLIREARRLRSDLPVIVLTGYVTEAAERAVAGGIEGGFSLLSKPASARQLEERIDAILAGAHGWDGPADNGASCEAPDMEGA